MIRNREPGKTALVVPSLHGGGAERVMVTVANGLHELGCEVDLITMEGGGAYQSELVDGIRRIDLGRKRTLTAIGPLARYLRRERPKHLLSTLTHVNIMVVFARLLARVKTRLVLRETVDTSAPGFRTPGFRNLLLGYLKRRTYPWADAVVAVSRGVQQDLVMNAGVLEDKIEVIPNPAVTRVLTRKASETRSIRLPGPEGLPLILGVGRLTRQKDFGTLIRAFAKLRANRSARLLILGEGEEREGLEELVARLEIENVVTMPGFVANPFPFMRAAAVVVLSSRWEGMPNVILQAMACGTPVVATDCPSGPREILGSERWGALVPVGDEAAMARQILRALDGELAVPSLRQLDAQYGEDRVVRHYLTVLTGNGETDRRRETGIE